MLEPISFIVFFLLYVEASKKHSFCTIYYIFSHLKRKENDC
ncbi:hypothetical protein FH5_05073 [Priestia endophytica]|nr:hypothetical protein FH5_05073 [Priestia endophytica]